MNYIGHKNIVITSQRYASKAGLSILKAGGNAVDAAIATAACLTVVEPTGCGIGGDAFAIVWMNDKMYGLNGSGPSPSSICHKQVKALGHENMPIMGWIPITVPGIPASWASLSERFGRLPLTEVLKPAIQLATEGFKVTPVVQKSWSRTFDLYSKHEKKEDFKEWFRVFAPNGRAPNVGEHWSSLDHANTLRELADTNCESFYRGSLANKIIRESKKSGGFFTSNDLANYQVSYIDPISTQYNGYDIWELPPNCQGIIPLVALNILKELDLKKDSMTDMTHKEIEAIKIAFSSCSDFITCPSRMSSSALKILLGDTFAKQKKDIIKDYANVYSSIDTAKSGTVYLCTADTDGNMVSYIQSNYYGFGSGIVIPNTGITMQNRGFDFSLDQNHPNALLGGKKPYHTIIPGFITRQNTAIGPFGLMGGYMQPQGHVQLLVNLLTRGLSPQESLNAPRFFWRKEKEVDIESTMSDDVIESLKEKGHMVNVPETSSEFGLGQIIFRNPDTKVIDYGTDPRCDGSIEMSDRSLD